MTVPIAGDKPLMDTILAELHRLTETWGVDHFGIADLARARDFIADQGGAGIAAYNRALAIGIALPHAIVDALPRRHERQVAVMYHHHAYDVINDRLDQVASLCASLIQRHGYEALPIPASKRVDDERICGAFSHKLAAHLAGLGWIGKSCLLITPQHGPRVRWTSVLTCATLPANHLPLRSHCGDCRECVDNCPVKAFSGRPFAEGQDRSVRYDAAKCERHFAALRRDNPEMAVCGMCLYICPHGRRAAAKLRGQAKA
jgi:epoxyqueuosine reductase